MFLHSKGNYKQHEKTILRMGENIFKQSSWQKIHLQNVQNSHASQYPKKKKKDPIKKWTDVLCSYFSNEDIQVAKKAHEKMFNVTNY